jgi:LemA protein
MKRITVASTIAALAIVCFFVIILSSKNCDECFSPSVMAVKFFISGLIITVGTIYFTRIFLQMENIVFDIESQPLLETAEATVDVPFAGEGIVEPKGEKIITSPYTKTPCVYFHSIKEMYVRSGRSSHWEIVENISLFIPFYIKDERGKLEVCLSNLDDDFSKYKIPVNIEGVPNPKNSEVDCDPMLYHNSFSPADSSLGVFSSGTKYRWSEFVLRPNTKVFAYGMVSKQDGELFLHEDERCPLIISKKNRDQYVEEFYGGGNLVYFSHFLVSIGYTIALLSANYFFHFNPISLLTLLLIGNAIITGSVIFSLYNRIVSLKERALNSLSNINIELKRRKDLIPSLVDVVKGYSKHEKELQQIVAESRAETIFSKEMPKETKPVIPSLVAIIENYPDLKASEQFQYLMRTLVDTEERIAYSREFYNRSIRKYNTLIQQFPFLLVSSFLKIKQMDFISISRGETEATKVSLDKK